MATTHWEGTIANTTDQQHYSLEFRHPVDPEAVEITLSSDSGTEIEVPTSNITVEGRYIKFTLPTNRLEELDEEEFTVSVTTPQ